MFCPPLVTKLGDEKTAGELPQYEITVPYKALQCMQTFFPDGSASSRDFIATEVSLHAQVEAKRNKPPLQILTLYCNAFHFMIAKNVSVKQLLS